MRLQPNERWYGARVELFLLEPHLVTEAYVAWLNDPAVNRYLESRFVAHDLDSTRQFVASALADPDTVLFGIRSIELARHVGNIKLGPIDRRHGVGEIGIMIGERTAWGRGIARDAIEVLAGIARTDLGLRKVTAGCYASNIGSERAFTSAGFNVEGRRTAQYVLDGHPEDSVILGRVL